MKRILLSAFALILSVLAYSQTTLDNPKIGLSTASNVKLEKIELRDTATVLWFHVNQTPGIWIRIPKETYIQPVGAKEKLFIVSADGIPMNDQYVMPESGEVNYKLIFPKIDTSVAKVDYGEDGGTWFIYDIQLKPELVKSIVPKGITGNWFRSDNAQWEISLFDSVAIYKSKVWKYQKYAEKDGLGKISLKNGTKFLNIYAKANDNNTCLIGETPTKLVKYSNLPDQSVIPADKEFFSLPVLKMDTVTYCGYIKGFSPRFPRRTGMVYVNNVLTGVQASYLLTIADDGTFKVKFLHNNPQGIFIQNPFSFETIFLEPGKTTFQLLDFGSKTNPVLFMGDCARINTDLIKLKSINGIDYYQMLDKILDFTPEQYKAWLIELKQKDFDLMAHNVQTYSLCSKAALIKKLEMDYRYASKMMEYGWNIEAAYRKKNNIPQDQRTISFIPAKPDSAYYTFITNELVNNPLAVLTPDYSTFINRLMFLEILRGAPQSFSTADILTELEKSGYKFTPEEKELAVGIKMIESPEMKKVQVEFQAKYGKQQTEFFKKYNDKIKALYKEKAGSFVTTATIIEYLAGQNVVFTDEEETFLAAKKEYDDNPVVKKQNSFQEKYMKQISEFHINHREVINEIMAQRRLAERNEKIQKILGIQPSFALDIMTSQEICRPIVSEMTPVSNEKLIEYQKNISTPFISSYIALQNNATKASIEANKKLTGSKVNEVPKTAGDKVFDAIMEKYKGKVVYVDFWATWCSPCRSGIERIKPLKEEMASENVAFVYITNQTSPKTTYDNMIPTIKGEHYRVSADEWNILSGMFKISGIPHYALVGKNGSVINPQLGHLQNEELKTLLMKYIRE